jgi:hypothetical protein
MGPDEAPELAAAGVPARAEWLSLPRSLAEAGAVPCQVGDPTAWWPERRRLRTASARDALAACERCPAAGPCLTYALAADERFGIWGGTTPDQRRRSVGAGSADVGGGEVPEQSAVPRPRPPPPLRSPVPCPGALGGDGLQQGRAGTGTASAAIRWSPKSSRRWADMTAGGARGAVGLPRKGQHRPRALRSRHAAASPQWLAGDVSG